jgi:hypothetical protein
MEELPRSQENSDVKYHLALIMWKLLKEGLKWEV